MTAARPNAALLRELRAKAKAEGKCGTCRYRPAKPGRVTCVECLKNHYDSKRELETKRIAKGLCRCGAQTVAGLVTCAPCTSKRRDRTNTRVQKLLAARLCTRCGAVSTANKRGRYLCVGCTRILAVYAKRVA